MRKVFLIMFGSTLAVAAALALDRPPGEPLASPFPRADVLAGVPMAVSKKIACRTPPKAVRDIVTVSKFGADRRVHGSTVIDPAAASEFAEGNRALTEFTRQVADLTNGFSKFNTSGVRDARCALMWLNSWAEQDALLGKVNEAGVPLRKWELASLAAAYLKIRSAPNDPEQSARVRRWLARVASAVRADYSRNPEADSRSNNHLNWAAWAVMAAAIAADDRDLFEWSVDRFRFAIAKIEPDGTLPLELKRRQLAFAYHNFALGPLVMLREGASANGLFLTPGEDARLQALIDLLIAGIDDPDALRAKAGPQDFDHLSPASLAWLEPYYARSRDPRAARLLARYRPLSYTRLGGNLTELFGDRAAAPAAKPKGGEEADRSRDQVGKGGGEGGHDRIRRTD
ncbi:MAG: alginate lyase family protein [Novosphingobium sp.]